MKKFSFKAVALAAGLAVGGSAFAAALDMDATTPAPVKFASELVISGAGTSLGNATNNLDAKFKVGVGIAVSTTRYVRVDLSSGAFTANPGLTVAAAAGPTTYTATLTSGGAGSSFAVFTLTTDATNAIVATDVATVAVNTGVDATSQADLTIRARVFSIPAFADAPTETNSLYSKTATLITFTPALKFVDSDATALIADYAATTPFTGFTTTAPYNLGTLVVTDSLAAKASGAAATLGDILNTKTVVTVNGDFSFVKKASGVVDKTKVTFGGVQAVSLTDTKAVFGTTTTGWTGTQSTGTKQLTIVDIDGSVAIPAGSYTADVAFTANSGYSIANLSAKKAGSITRNGTTLVAPIFNVPTGWISRLVLTNNGNTNLGYRVTGLSEAGSTITLTGDAASGSAVKNGTTVIDLGALTTVTGGMPRGGLMVTVDGAEGSITGAIQTVGPSGNLSNYTMTRK